MTDSRKMPSRLRQLTKSVSGILPGDVEDPDSTSGVVEDKLARILAGLKSQVMSRDPETNETYLGGWQRLKEDWNGISRSERRKGQPGIIDETLSLPTLGALLPGVDAESIPDWAFEAADRVDAMHKSSREEMGLNESKGFAQNAAEGLGTMLGQMPIPLARTKSVAPAARSVGSVAKKIVGGIPEWFSPTVDPSMANYLSGAGFGGALGAYEDYAEEKAAEESESAEFSRNVKPFLKYYVDKGHMPGFDPEESLRNNPVNNFASGGKVARLKELKELLQSGNKERLTRLLDEEPALLNYFSPSALARLIKTQEPIGFINPGEFSKLASPPQVIGPYDDVSYLERRKADVQKRTKKVESYAKSTGIRSAPQLWWNDTQESGIGGIMGHQGRARASFLDSVDSKVPVSWPFITPSNAWGVDEKELLNTMKKYQTPDRFRPNLVEPESLEEKLKVLRSIKEWYDEPTFQYPSDRPRRHKLKIDAFAEGGKVGALHNVLKALAINPHAKMGDKASLSYLHEDPIEDILYAAQQSKMPDAERKELLILLNTSKTEGQVSDQLIEKLLNLHGRLFQSDQVEKVSFKSRPSLAPAGPNGTGTLPALSWEEILNSSE